MLVIRKITDFLNGTQVINDIEESVQDPLQWSKSFETGTYPVKMEVLYENGETIIRESTLKLEVFWIKMRNVRY
jgi:hypothetical protein